MEEEGRRSGIESVWMEEWGLCAGEIDGGEKQSWNEWKLIISGEGGMKR